MDIEKYLTDFTFKGNCIKKLIIENDFVAFPVDSETTRKVDVKYKLDDIATDKDGIGLIGIAVLNTTVLIERRNRTCKIEISVEGCFATNEKNEKETFEQMIRINGCATLYSITRAIISSVSSQTFSVGNITLPMINVYQMQTDTPEEK